MTRPTSSAKVVWPGQPGSTDGGDIQLNKAGLMENQVHASMRAFVSLGGNCVWDPYVCEGDCLPT
jgi:hypothetical protein